MQDALWLVAGLFAATIMIALMFRKKDDDAPAPVAERIPVPPLEQQAPRNTQPTDGERAMREWLLVLYRDNPMKIDRIVEDIAARLRAQGLDAEHFPPQQVVAVGAGEQVDGAHAFGIDWKDGETFAAYADDMAARFRFTLQWEGTDRHRDAPDALMRHVHPQFAARNAALYHAETDGDYYFVLIVPKRDEQELLAASAKWGLRIRPADQTD